MQVSASSCLSRVSLILEGLSLFASGLLAGTFVRGEFGFRPATAELPTALYVRMRQSLIRNLRRLMLPLMLVALGSAGLAAVGSRRPSGRRLRWAGLACTALPLVITRYGNVPLNEQMLTWSPETPPSDVSEVVRRWETFDTLRSLAAIAAFACQVAATTSTVNSPSVILRRSS